MMRAIEFFLDECSMLSEAVIVGLGLGVGLRIVAAIFGMPQPAHKFTDDQGERRGRRRQEGG